MLYEVSPLVYINYEMIQQRFKISERKGLRYGYGIYLPIGNIEGLPCHPYYIYIYFVDKLASF